MKKKILVIFMSIVMAIAICFGVAACNETPNPTKLGAVTVELEGNVAVWDEVAGASRYAYKINNGVVIETTLREVELEDRQFIKVKAVGDGIRYSDGDFCPSVTYYAAAKIPLGEVTVTMQGSMATWDAVTDASGYAYKIDGGEEIKTTARGVILQDGQSIVVKAVGDGIVYSDGPYSTSVEYDAPTVPEYTAVVVEKTIDEGDTLLLSQINLPTGFAWTTPSTVVEGSGRYEATYDGQEATVYVLLTVNSTSTPEMTVPYDTIVVKKTVQEGTALTLADISLTEGFAWVDDSTPITDSGYFDAIYAGSTARIYVDLIFTPAATTPDEEETVVPYDTIVIQKTIDEGDALTLADVDLTEGFVWKDATTQVTASGYFDATYNGVDARIYIHLTINAATEGTMPEEELVPAYTTIVVKYTINEGETLYLNQIVLPTGFAWLVPGGVVTESGPYAATYTEGNKTVDAEVYLDLTVLPLPEEEKPAYETIVVQKTITEGETLCLDQIALPQGFTWQVPGGVVTESGYYAAYYDGNIAARVYVDLTVNAAPLTKLGNVTVSLKGHTASWGAVAGASRYAYRINDGEVVETTLRSVTLNVQDVIKVKAIGDGVTYSDGDYCTAVMHDTIYDGPINDGDTVVTINALETAADVSAMTGVTASGVINTLKSHGNASFYAQYEQIGSITIPMKRNGAALTIDKLRLYSSLRLSVMVHGDDMYSDAAKANAPMIRIGSQVWTHSNFKAGWNDLYINIDNVINSGYVSGIKVEFKRANAGSYMIYFDNLAGVYAEKLDLGNVMVFGDSYSTYDGYLRDNRFFYYADRPVSRTDVTSVTQTWWGQVIADTNSNLIMNDSVAGSTVAGYTYGCENLDGWPPQDNFVERIDSLIAQGYFETHDVGTIFMYGGTNDAWGQCHPNFNGQYTLGSAKYSGWTTQDLDYVLPAYCYFISKALEHTDATIVVVLNSRDVMSRSYFTSERYDVQGAIISAIKGFAEYGNRVQIVALSDDENNTVDISIGDHPTVMGMGAIKDQILNILYERKYLTADKCTEYGTAVEVKTVLESFSSAPTQWHYDGATGSATKNTTYTKDGDGSWACTANTANVMTFIVGVLTSDISAYSKIRVRVYSTVAGAQIYMDAAQSVHLGTTAAGWNEFTIDASRVPLKHADAADHIRLAYKLPSTSAVLYFDSVEGIK